MPLFQIALAGATGNLGLPILKALLDAGFGVTVLSRIGGNSSKLKPHPNLTIKEVDFNSVHTLTSALIGAQVVISCLATLAIGSQNPLIDAAVNAGVKRFIPAEFGMNSQNPLSVQLPVCAESRNAEVPPRKVQIPPRVHLYCDRQWVVSRLVSEGGHYLESSPAYCDII